MNFQTKYTYESNDGEINLLPSMTVPDESYTVRELLEKFVRGIPPSVSQNVQYDEDDDLDFGQIDPTRLGSFDLADLTEMEVELRENLRLIAEAKAKQEPAPAPVSQPPAPDVAPAS